MPLLLWFLLHAQVTLYEDKAVYKLKNEVVFQSDLENLSNKYNIYRCHRPKSALFTAPLKNNFLNNLQKLNLKNLNKDLLLEFLKLEKLLLYADSQELGVELKNFKYSSSCREKLSDKDLKSFLSFDSLLETRFSRDGQLLEESIESLVETIDHQYPHELFL
jgi:hypothetical protein